MNARRRRSNIGLSTANGLGQAATRGRPRRRWSKKEATDKQDRPHSRQTLSQSHQRPLVKSVSGIGRGQFTPSFAGARAPRQTQRGRAWVNDRKQAGTERRFIEPGRLDEAPSNPQY